MLKSFTPYMRALICLTALTLLFSVVSAYWHRVNNHLVDFYHAPIITDTHNNILPSYRSGGPVVVHYFVDRAALGCFADYYQILSGPVVVQLPPVRSTILTNKKVRRHIPYLYELPAGMPAGKYHWTQHVYPTCGGEESFPYEIKVGEINISH